ASILVRPSIDLYQLDSTNILREGDASRAAAKEPHVARRRTMAESMGLNLWKEWWAYLGLNQGPPRCQREHPISIHRWIKGLGGDSRGLMGEQRGNTGPSAPELHPKCPTTQLSRTVGRLLSFNFCDARGGSRSGYHCHVRAEYRPVPPAGEASRRCRQRAKVPAITRNTLRHLLASGPSMTTACQTRKWTSGSGTPLRLALQARVPAQPS